MRIWKRNELNPNRLDVQLQKRSKRIRMTKSLLEIACALYKISNVEQTSSRRHQNLTSGLYFVGWIRVCCVCVFVCDAFYPEIGGKNSYKYTHAQWYYFGSSLDLFDYNIYPRIGNCCCRGGVFYMLNKRYCLFFIFGMVLKANYAWKKR